MEAINWYAIYVKSKHEFVANEELGKKGIESYLPRIKKLRQWKDRKKLVEFPLFPGYLFVRVNPNPSDFVRVLKARGVVSLVSAEAGCPVAVSNEEIDSLKIIVESGSDIDIYPHLKAGTRVCIKRGALKGAVGSIVRKESEYLFLVNIEILGRCIGVKVYADDLCSTEFAYY